MFEVLQSDAGRAHVKAINTAAYVLLDEYDALSHLLKQASVDPGVDLDDLTADEAAAVVYAVMAGSGMARQTSIAFGAAAVLALASEAGGIPTVDEMERAKKRAYLGMVAEHDSRWESAS